MPLSFGIPLGLIVALAGVFLLFFTRWKRIAKVIVGLGITITLGTVIVIILALDSSM